MLTQTIILVLVTLIPALELRASIPFGIFGKEQFGIVPGLMSWPLVAAVCMAANIVLGWTVFWLLGPLLHWLERFAWFRRRLEPILQRAQNKIKPYVDKYGELGVALFIGVPLPGSGVYTGAVGAFLLGLDKRRFAIANLIGVLIAGTLVTAICLAIQAGQDIPFRKLWIKAAPATAAQLDGGQNGFRPHRPCAGGSADGGFRTAGTPSPPAPISREPTQPRRGCVLTTCVSQGSPPRRTTLG